MARARLSYHSNIDRRYLYDQGNGDIVRITKSVNKKLNSILKLLDEVEIFMEATKEYAKLSRSVISNLRFCIVFLESEVKSAEEAILESEKAIARLKSKIDPDFQSILSHTHKSFSAHKNTNGAKRNRRCRNEGNRFDRNVSPANLAANKRVNSENASARFPNSETNSEVSNPDSRPNYFMSFKNRLKCLISDLEFQNDCTENLDGDNRSASRKNRSKEMSVKPWCEIDVLSLRKNNRSDTSSNSEDYKAYNGYTENESDLSYQNDYCNKLLNESLDKWKNLCEPERDLPSRKACRNRETNSLLYNSYGLDVCSTEELVDSFETNEEFSKNRRSLLSLNRTEDSVAECDKNSKPESPLRYFDNHFQRRNSSVPTNRCTDSKYANTDRNQLVTSDNYLDQNISLSDIEFSEFNQIHTSLEQKGILKNTNENSLDAVASLRNASLQSESSEEFSKLSDKSCCSSSISEDEMETSNYFSSENEQYIREMCAIECLEHAALFDAYWDGHWNGKTLIVENSTKAPLKENNREFSFNEGFYKSLNQINSDGEKEENSNYISINSSHSSSKTAYFSFMREQFIEDIAEEKFATSNSNALASKCLDTQQEDTTDTSVYDHSSDAQQNDKMSTSACESTDTSICNEFSYNHQIKSNSSMSLTEISSNSSMYENSNSFQFRSDSSEKENSCSNAYASSFSMSKEFSCLSETDISYASFRGGLPTSSASANEESSYNASLEVNVSQASEGRNLAIESSELVTYVSKHRPFECKSREQYDEFDVHVPASNESTHDTSKQVSFETESNLKKSRSSEILANNLTNEMIGSLPNVKLGNAVKDEPDIMKCAFRRAKSYGKEKNINGKIYSKSVRSMINGSHCIQ